VLHAQSLPSLLVNSPISCLYCCLFFKFSSVLTWQVLGVVESVSTSVLVNLSVHIMATHLQQSLPSFAQAFSPSSLNSISTGSNSLPPIQPHRATSNRRPISPSRHQQTRMSNSEKPEHRTHTRKRSRSDEESTSRHDNVSGSECV
jgi:hypothetical protein